MRAQACGEPLAGTAPVARRWLCFEHPGPWSRDVSQSPEPAIRSLAARAVEAGWRMQLIRRPGRRVAPSAARRVFFADTTPTATRMTELVVTAPEDLATLPLPADGDLPGAEVPDPVLLVCTHGRRDRCCAMDGRALVSAIVGTGETSVWESTHLGGHRFAPTAAVLPTGYSYGWLDPATALTALKAARAGEVELTSCRGRATWSSAGQVAELAVRSATGLTDAAAIVDVTVERDRALVTARDGRRWGVRVHRAQHQDRPASCGAKPEPFTAWHAGLIHKA